MWMIILTILFIIYLISRFDVVFFCLERYFLRKIDKKDEGHFDANDKNIKKM